jgi:hypothetical protein
MSLIDSLRKGLRFFLMSFGVSSPNKTRPAAKKPAPPVSPGPPK